MAFTPVDLPTYPPDIVAQVIDDYSARLPGWEPSDANPEIVLIQELAFALAQTNAGLAQREIAELELIGRRRGRPRRLALQAVGLARFTVAPGFTLPAATQGTVPGPDGLVAFQTIDQAGGQPGITALADVPIIAVLSGPAANTASGVGAVYDQFDDVISVEVTTPLAGGQDEEDLEAYLGELVDFLQLFFDDPTLVNARQLAIFVRDHPLVERVLTINLHVPAGGRLPDGTVSAIVRDGVPGAIAAYPVMADGEPPPAFVRDEIAGLVEERREAGMILGVGVPSYTPIDVTFTASGSTAAITAAETAVRAYLAPATWGSPTSGDRTTSPGSWVLDRIVRFGEIYALVDNVDGINHVDTVSIMGATNTNYTLTGPAPLTRAGTISGSLAA